MLAICVSLLLAAPVSASPAPPAGGAACASGAGCFQLNAVSIEGATVYKAGALAPTYQAYLTREVDNADLVKIAAAVSDRYRADGYFLSRAAVPAQTRGGHVARIRVYEGYIGEVAITGDGGAAAAKLLRPLQNKRPLRLADLQAALRLAAEVPGLQLRTHLEPTPEDPARHRLVVEARQKRLQLGAYVDNRGPKSVGPWQASMRAAVNSVVRTGDQLAVAVLTVPEHVKRFAYGEVSYSAPVTKSLRLRGSLGASTSSEGGEPVSSLVGGKSWEATLGLTKVWAMGRSLRAWAGLVADKRHIEHHWNSAYGYSDDVLVLRGRFEATHAKSRQSSNVFAQVSAGERGEGGAGRLAALSRPGASKQFVKVNGHVSHYRDLGRHAGIYVAADGQWTPDKLMISEAFTVGGALYGRGYNYAALIGDKGVAGTVELRAGFDPKIRGISFLQGYGFVDAGKVWGGPFAGSQSLASAGGGVRVRLANRATLGVEAARRLNKTPSDPKRGWRPSVYLSAEF